MKRRIVYLSLVSAVLLAGCVSSKKYAELEQTSNKCAKQLSQTKMNLKEAQSNNEELSRQLEQKTKQLTDLQSERDNFQSESERLKQANTETASRIAALEKQLQESLKSKSSNLQSLNEELLKTREELSESKELLLGKESELKSLQDKYSQSEKTLGELQDKLKEKQAEMEALHKKISQALLGFADKGLNVQTKDGKVYVSMEEKLLFASGSWSVSSEGEKALGELAAVLAANPDISIMVEGHTDNVPMKGRNQVKDNWDLSVMRASAITKILLNNEKIAPERVIPSGRGEYCPLVENSSAEARAKNRRSEIILAPKTDELLKMLE